MDIWRGAILGDVFKHRDYEHDSFYEHLLDEGAILGYLAVLSDGEQDEYVSVPESDDGDDADGDDGDGEDDDEHEQIATALRRYTFMRDPITGQAFGEPKVYYALIVLHNLVEYRYYIPAPPGGAMPSNQLVIETLEQYNHNQGRDRSSLADDMVD
jgi:hypothetical protein